jgi:hypothetical protein
LIVLDHGALASSQPAVYERDYLKYYLSMTSQKAVVSVEVWESFRKKIMAENSPEMAQEIIAVYRGIVEPEITHFENDYSEKEPTKEHTDAELVESTKDLIHRKALEIKYFICADKAKYQNPEIYTLNVEEFYYHCMGELNLVEEYLRLTKK